MLKVKEAWRGCVSLLLEVRALLQGLGSLQRSHRQTEQDRLITWSPGVAPKYLSSSVCLVQQSARNAGVLSAACCAPADAPCS